MKKSLRTWVLTLLGIGVVTAVAYAAPGTFDYVVIDGTGGGGLDNSLSFNDPNGSIDFTGDGTVEAADDLFVEAGSSLNLISGDPFHIENSVGSGLSSIYAYELWLLTASTIIEGSTSVDIGGSTTPYIEMNSTGDIDITAQNDITFTNASGRITSNPPIEMESSLMVRVVASAPAAAGTVTPDGLLCNQISIQMPGGNITLAAPTNAETGQFLRVRIRQDGVGSRTVAWNAAYKFGTTYTNTLTTGANRIDYFDFMYNAVTTSWDCVNASKGLL